MEFNVSPGEHGASEHPIYAFFECSTFLDRNESGKFDQVENHLAYHLERQPRRQNRPQIKVVDIIAVTGVATTLPWHEIAKSLGQSGLDARRHIVL